MKAEKTAKRNYLFLTIKIIYQNAPVRFLLCIGMLVFTSFFSVLNLMATNHLTDKITHVPYVWEETLFAAALFCLTLLLNQSKSFINLLGSYLWITAELALQRALIQKAANKTMLFYDTPNSYQSIQKAKEGYKNAVGTTMMLISAVTGSLLSVFFMAGYLWHINRQVVIVLLVLVALKGIHYRAETKRLHRLREEQAEKTKKCELLSSCFWEKDARVYGASGYLYTQWKELNETIIRKRSVEKRKNIVYLSVSDLLSFIGYALVIVMSVSQNLQNADMAGGISEIIVLFVAMESVFANVNNIILEFGNLAENISMSKDLFDFLFSADDKPGLKEFCRDSALKLENVSFRYPSAAADTLKGINLTVSYGEKVAVVGKNGSGKSTLVKLLCGLYEPTKGGRYYGNRLELAEEGYENVATMFQEVNTYCLSLAENVCVSETKKLPDKEKAEKILKDVMGEEWISAYPDGMETKIGRAFGGVDLSGGEKQKISLARTFYRKSSLLFFDEPSSALDPLAEDRLYQDILDLSKGKTVFFITHRLASVKLADRIIVIDHGEIVENGNFEELMAYNGLFAEMYHKQKKGLE